MAYGGEAQTMKRFDRWAVPALLAAAVLALGSCSVAASATESATQAAPSNTWISPQGLSKAAAFRRSVGLRSDDAWLRSVASAPDAMAAVARFGVPLMPPEAAELEMRASSADAIAAVVSAYGTQHPDDYVGLVADPQSGRVVAKFARNVELHEKALRTLIAPAAPLDVVKVQWTKDELESLAHRISHDGWLRAQRYDLLDLGVDIASNRVQLLVSTADPDAVVRITDHYQAQGKLVVTTDGTGVTLLPTGSLSGVALDHAGRPVAGLDVEFHPDIAGAGPRGDRGLETDSGGRFSITTQATGYTVVLLSSRGPDGEELTGSDRIEVGSARADIPTGGSTFVVVEVRLPSGG
ncbi:MAG TPA: hypothetical protein VFS32_11715 [Candidatus Limnocylindrales bacterium]|nr:hypothetical protein [Candidatus Limnocylindrales bacterium]